MTMKREHDPILDRVRAQLPPSADAFERLQRRREAKAMRSRVVAGAVALGVTAALITGLVLSQSRPPGSVPDGSTTAGAVPNAVPLVARDGQYYYVSKVIFEHPSGVVDDGQADPLTPVRAVGGAQWWVGLDDSGRIDSVTGAPVAEQGRFGAGEFPGELLPGLSTDPDRLLSQLIERVSEGGASPRPVPSSIPAGSTDTLSVLESATGLLELIGPSFLTPEQGRAVFEVMQGLDGVATEPGLTTDPLGRPAVQLSSSISSISYGSGPTYEDRWYFEPSTGQFMGQVSVDRSGDVVYAVLVRAAGIADSLDDPPSAAALYVPVGAPDPSFKGSPAA
jgi:hypothetical protein